jgi:hypothetical protein
VAEHLPSKHEVLSLHPSAAKKKEKEEKEIWYLCFLSKSP